MHTRTVVIALMRTDYARSAGCTFQQSLACLMSDAPATPQEVDAFIARWQSAQAAEKSNGQPFLIELCALIGATPPDPAVADTTRDAYVFERPVTFADGARGIVDLYRRSCFVLETKQGFDDKDAEQSARRRRRKGHGKRGTPAWEAAMDAARAQAVRYAQNLEASEPVPPLVVVADVGYCLDLYADFGGSGRVYAPFPDAARKRIHLPDLRDPDVRERLRLAFDEPLALDPTRYQARVTRDLAARLADLARTLDEDGSDAEQTAAFLTRCLFCFFAEDAGLLPDRAFSRLLESYRADLGHLPRGLSGFFRAMDEGGYVGEIREDLRQFDGQLFRDRYAPTLSADQLEALVDAASMDWQHVEPAIFGTLVERALDPARRRHMGAHFTPRAYVERVIGPAVIEPLREEWDGVRAAADLAEQAAETADEAGKPKVAQRRREEARALLSGFLTRLASVRVLDPACGSGNFLYVTFAGLKALEGEVRQAIGRAGGVGTLELEGAAVTPHQMMGIEKGARAASVADLVLWIGYLQWHRKTHGDALPLPEPILQGYGQVEHRDALLAPDGSPAPWPDCDFVVGNPPFVGKGEPMRAALGQDGLDALQRAYPHVPASADLVMYWWDRAARLVRQGGVRRFGLITTNSITQTFNRRVTSAHLDPDEAQTPSSLQTSGGARRAEGSASAEVQPAPPLALAYAIADHPWADDGADVRMAVTVGASSADFDPDAGVLVTVTDETPTGEGLPTVELDEQTGRIHADLTVGADVTAAEKLEANVRLSGFGMMLAGRGFVLSREKAKTLGLDSDAGRDGIIRPTLNGRDLAKPARDRFVIDLFPLDADEARLGYPAVYEHIVREVKPQRDTNRMKSRRERWWLHGATNVGLRAALEGLERFIATPETAKHRLFSFVDAAVLPEHKLVNVASRDAYHLGVLSSRVHTTWADAAGGNLGVGNDSVYNKGRCFETFPFPDPTPEQQAAIRQIGEAIDAHRKARQQEHPKLGLTDLYNAVEAVRAGRTLTPKEEEHAAQGHAHTLADLHRRLDAAVLDAYGWPDLAPESPAFAQQVLTRLVALNGQRAQEEATGHVRYLRPAFQNPSAAGQAAMPLPTAQPAAAQPAAPRPWPAEQAAQFVAVRQTVTALSSATPAAVADRFKGAGPATVTPILDTLAQLGLLRQSEDTYAA